jgi:hypothetical protein
MEREDWMIVFSQVNNLMFKSIIEICASKNYIITLDEAVRLDPSKLQIEKVLMSISSISEAVVMKGVIDSLSYVPIHAIDEMRAVCKTLLVKEFNNLYRRALTDVDLIQVIAEELNLGEIEVAKEEKYCQVRMPSGEVKQVLSTCRASIGQVGNTDNENINLGKAGRNRWRGIRPSVRGMSMNPVDHPLGGGEGVGKGHHPVTPWGQPCKGYKTRNSKRTDYSIVKRRK